MAIIESKTIPNITAYADAVKAGFTGSYEAWCSVLGSISGDQEAVSINKVHYTLLARGWSNNVYDLEYVYPSTDYLFLFIDKDGDNITEEQLSWWYAADMSGSTDNKIIANDETPEVDIPIIITMIEKTTIGGGGDGNYQEKTVNPQEQTQQVTADSGYDALSKVVVNGARLQEKTVTLGSAQQITPDSGYYGLKKVNVPAAPTPSLGTKSISVNGTYNASADNLDGFSSVEVNVSGGGGTYQQKTVHPSTSQQSVQPDQGYDALSAVVVEAMDLESKTAQVSQTSQTITPTSGKDGLSRVEIPAALLQTKNVTLGSSAQQITADSGYYGLEQVNVPAASTPELQSKTVHPSTEQQTVLPDTGKDGLSSVVVEAMNLQSKTATASTTAITVTPDANADGLSQVTVNAINLQSKQVTPSGSAQIVTADQNYDGLSQVEVAAAPQPSLGTKNITANGTYTAASDDLDGFSSVTVNVSGGGGDCAIMDLLWTNPSPTSGFAAQTVSIDLTDYDAVVICGIGQKDLTVPNPFPGSAAPPVYNQCYVEKGSSGNIPMGTQSAGNACTNWRTVTVSDSGVTFGAGYIKIGTSTTSNDNYAVPIKIYGVKVAEEPTLITKSITTNGTYNASSDDADGYSSVTVNVPSSGGGIDLLWTNPDPTSVFPAYTVSLDLSDYDYIALTTTFNWSNSGNLMPSSQSEIFTTRSIFAKGTGGYVLFGASTSDPVACVYREVSISNTGVTFGGGYIKVSGSSATLANGNALPYKIYGIKGTLQ